MKMAFSLLHIPEWNALKIGLNGQNNNYVYSKYLNFMEQIANKHPIDNYTTLIPAQYFDSWMKQFKEVTTMSQTEASIRGNETSHFPELTYELKHMDQMKLSPFPFQEIGIQFLLSVKQGIIGDEVGLGKTVQGLGASVELHAAGIVNKTMVVCLNSLKYQWLSEVKKFTNLDAIVVDGTPKKRKAAYEEWQNGLPEILIIGYDSLRVDIDIIKEFKIDVMVVDEIHKIKNRGTKIYQAMMNLNPEYKFGLTGTPLQNKPEEVFAIMSWIDPNVLGKITAFRKHHVIVGEKFGRRFIELGYKNLDDIRDKIAPRLIRRLKKEVAPDLPEIINVVARGDMSKPQHQLYKAIEEDFENLQNEIRQFHETLSPQDEQRGVKHEREDAVLGYLYMMQAVSDHPLLLAQGNSNMAKKYLPLIRKCTTSPKLELLMEELQPVIESGSKVVVFSQYVRMVHLIAKRVQEVYKQNPYLIYGEVSPKERQEILEDYKKHPERHILLMSDAGSTGLNISESDFLVNYSQTWSSSTRIQRNGRIHRINSDFDHVTILDMVMNDTIDEKILEAIERKTALSNGLIEKTEDEQEWMKKLLGD